MQPSIRSLDQILAELNTVYEPQVNSLRQRQSMIPGQIAEEEKGLGAKQEQAFGDILGGARRRGMGFSGIPLGEQAKYTSTEYLPALARLRQSGREQAMSLEDAILGINERRQANALQQRQYEQSRYDTWQANQEQLAESRRQAAANNFSPTFGGGGGQTGGAQASATLTQRADKGFNFTDADGRAISAAQYAQKKGIPFRSLLQKMANAGDAGAKQALGFVGDDYGYNAAKVGNNQNVANLLNSLMWGVTGVKTAQPATPNRVTSFLNSPVNLGTLRSAFGGR